MGSHRISTILVTKASLTPTFIGVNIMITGMSCVMCNNNFLIMVDFGGGGPGGGVKIAKILIK